MKVPMGGTKGKTYAFATDEDLDYHDAVIALQEGDAAPLIALLETESGRVHPLMQAALASMLRGDHPSQKLTLSRIGVGRPKGIPNHSDKEIADFVAGLSGVPSKVAIGKAAKKFKTSDSSIRAAITRRKKREMQFQKFLKAHGVIGN